MVLCCAKWIWCLTAALAVLVLFYLGDWLVCLVVYLVVGCASVLLCCVYDLLIVLLLWVLMVWFWFAWFGCLCSVLMFALLLKVVVWLWLFGFMRPIRFGVWDCSGGVLGACGRGCCWWWASCLFV